MHCAARDCVAMETLGVGGKGRGVGGMAGSGTGVSGGGAGRGAELQRLEQRGRVAPVL